MATGSDPSPLGDALAAQPSTIGDGLSTAGVSCHWLAGGAAISYMPAVLPSSADIPDLGLPLYGLRTWHLGGRVFAFDLDPRGEIVLWVDDRSLTRFPSGAQDDDPQLLATARAEWKALKKRLPGVLAQARQLLQQALEADEAWSLPAFQAEIVDHPLLRRLATRMVWAVLDSQGQPVAFGRPTPRGRWDLGVGRGPELPPGSAAVFLPRAEQLPDDVRRAWSARFPEQPVDQLRG